MKVPSALIVIVVAAMCFVALATVGRTAAAAADVAARMEQAGARRVVVVDSKAAGFINLRTLSSVAGLSTVEEANALGVPFDAVNGLVGRGGTRIPVWPVLGDSLSVGDLISGRAPQPGEALISIEAQQSVNLIEPAGFLATPDGATQYPIVGSFRARAAYADLGAGAIVASGAETLGRELRVVADDIASVEQTVPTILSILAPADPAGVYVDSPRALAETARDINAQLVGYGRGLLALILGVGGAFVAAVVLADVLVRRRDLGRRRTLGITRADLSLVVTGRAALTASIGASIGCSAGWIANQLMGSSTPTDFTAAIGVLAVMAAAVAALAPAWYACHLDPVAVMRTA